MNISSSSSSIKDNSSSKSGQILIPRVFPRIDISDTSRFQAEINEFDEEDVQFDTSKITKFLWLTYNFHLDILRGSSDSFLGSCCKWDPNQAENPGLRCHFHHFIIHWINLFFDGAPNHQNFHLIDAHGDYFQFAENFSNFGLDGRNDLENDERILEHLHTSGYKDDKAMFLLSCNSTMGSGFNAIIDYGC